MTILVPTLPLALAVRRRQSRDNAPRSLTLDPPAGPLVANEPIAVSGTYGGPAATITLTWLSGDTPIDGTFAGELADGAWTAFIHAPLLPGTYRLRATLDGVLSVDSAPIAVVSVDPNLVAALQFTGTGLPAEVIDIFGHAFPQGRIAEGAPVVLRRRGSGALHRAQMTVLRRWPDNSVMTAVFAAELPELAAGQSAGFDLLANVPHPEPGPPLSLAALLAGRSAVVRTWAPGDASAPLWTFDVVQAALSSSDRWMDGPLCVSTRVETPMPASANVEGRESVRLVVDVYASKDGFLELDVVFSNDRLPYDSVDRTAGGFPNCGGASFGYTIEIDGQIVYDQRPLAGTPAAMLRFAGQWIRRRGRNPAGTVIGYTVTRPTFRPDFEVLVASGVQTNYLRERSNSTPQMVTDHIASSILAARENDPYWHWSMSRDAGAVGGRPEIGDRTFSTMMWMVYGYPGAQFLTNRMFEAAATRDMCFRDWETGEWINPPDWPRFTISTGAGTSPPGTRKSVAVAPSGIPGWSRSVTDHITIDTQHHGALFWPVALLEGRRCAYDLMAARMSWIVMLNGRRHVPGTSGYLAANAPLPAWRGIVTPDHTTGAAWGPILNWDQTRGQAWSLRCLIDGAIILPDSWRNRTLYERHVAAFLNALAAEQQAQAARNDWPVALMGIGLMSNVINPVREVVYMGHFIIPSLVRAQRCGIGPDAARQYIVETLARYRCSWYAESTYNHRRFMSSRPQAISNTTSTVFAQNWAQASAMADAAWGASAETNETWTQNPGEPDYQRNAVMALLNVAHALDVPLDIRAMAADAAILCSSERIRRETGVNNFPTMEPQSYYGAFQQTNAIWPEGLTPERNAPPVILAGQSFEVRSDASVGTVVGIIRTRGPIPRNSGVGRTFNDAFVIAAQPPGNPFSISGGGVLRVANPAALTADSLTISVYCRTYEQRNADDPAIEHRSRTVPVTVTLRRVQAEIAAAGPFELGENSSIGAPVFTPSITNDPTGTVVWSKAGGDPDNLFTVDGATGSVTVAASLTGRANTEVSLVVAASNDAGTATRSFALRIIGAQFPPLFDPETQAFTVEEGVPVGTEITLGMTGSPAQSLTITLGNIGNRWQAVAPNVLRTTARIIRLDETSYTLGLSASNVAGSGSGTVGIVIATAPYVFGDLGSVPVLFAASAARRLRATYQGPLARVFRTPDGSGTFLDVFADAAGVADYAALADFAQGQACHIALYDQSAAERGLAQPAPGGYPLLTDGSGALRTVNGRAMMNHQGANRGLVFPNFQTHAGPSLAGFALCVRRGGQAGRVAIALSGTASENPGMSSTSFLLRSNSSNAAVAQLVSRGNTATAPSNTLPQDQPRVLWGTSLSGVSGERTRVGAGSTTASDNSTANYGNIAAAAHLVLGTRADQAQPWDGDLAEFLVLGGAVPPTTWQTVVAAMNGFYGIV